MIHGRDGPWADFPSRRHFDWRPVRGGFRSCHHSARRFPTGHGERRPKDHGERCLTDRDERRPRVHRAGREGDFRSCRHAPVHAPEPDGQEPDGQEPDDQEPGGVLHPSTNPRCRPRRRNLPTSQRRPVQSVRRPAADVNPIPWVNRGTDEAVLRWVARSSAEATQRRNRNSMGHRPHVRSVRRRRNAVRRSRRLRRRNDRSHPGRLIGATCRRSSVPPALRPRAILALSCPRPDRSSRRDPE